MHPFDAKLDAAKGLLAQCADGRELLDLAEQKLIPITPMIQPKVGSRGAYSRVENRVEINPHLKPTSFLATLVHELEHGHQHHHGLTKALDDPEKNTDLVQVRTTYLVAEAGAMARTGLVLCQLHQLGVEQPERAAGLQRPLRLELQDTEFADIYGQCLLEARRDPAALFNGQAFKRAAETYALGIDRMSGYVGAATAYWGWSVKRTDYEHLAEQQCALYRYGMEKDQDDPKELERTRAFRGQVLAEFHAALPALRPTLGPGKALAWSSPQPTDLTADRELATRRAQLEPARSREQDPEKGIGDRPERERDWSYEF